MSKAKHIPAKKTNDESIELPAEIKEVKPATLQGRVVTNYTPNANGKVSVMKKSTGKIVCMAIDVQLAEKLAAENLDLEIIQPND